MAFATLLFGVVMLGRKDGDENHPAHTRRPEQDFDHE